jgi:hypothetical protein
VKPTLTLTRWAALKALRASTALRRRPFLARELIYAGGRRGSMIAATGGTMDSLRGAGWIEAVPVCEPGEAMPFRSSGPMMAWQVTEAGHAAIAACPDTFPNGPVCDGDAA